ncbi:MAG: phosphotransferase [Pseudomonadota bacterium]
MTNDDRAGDRDAFLATTPWADAARTALQHDASTRRYWRLTRTPTDGNGKSNGPPGSALLMDAPPSLETQSCPPTASPAMREAMGYNACARLAGGRMAPFVEIARCLTDAGLSAPQILAHDEEKGFALIEDLGDDLFARLLDQDRPQADELTLYEAAVDVLINLARRRIRPGDEESYKSDTPLQTYDETAMLAETQLLTDWYVPHCTATSLAPDATQALREAWRTLIQSLPEPGTMVLRDYHAENLLWLAAREGLARTGVIDFQDGLWGHHGYDLVSLLEDARRDVNPAIVPILINRYMAGLGFSDTERAAFAGHYAILGAQRNAKILGIFARLANRDGKTRYLDLLPRVEGHFRRNLIHPLLTPIRTLIAPYLPHLTKGADA